MVFGFKSILFFLFVSLLTTQNVYDKCQSSSPLDIAFVVDASRSVNDTEWAQSKEFLLKFVPFINNTNSRGSIYQFHDDCYQFLGLTNDWNALNKTMDSLVRQGEGGTNTGDAILKAANDLLNKTRPDALQIIFLLTDGDQNTGNNDVLEVAKKTKDKGVVIVIVAVDEASTLIDVRLKLTKVASSGLYFPQEFYSQLTEEFLKTVSSFVCFKLEDVVGNKTLEVLNSKEVLLTGKSFLDDTLCKFVSQSNNKTFDTVMVNYNITFGSCLIPLKPDTYSLTIKSKYWRKESDSTITVTVAPTLIEGPKNLLRICQGDTIDLKLLNSKLQNNWLFQKETKSIFDFNKSEGCRTNADCPFNMFCFNCSLCGQTNCPNCSSQTGASCLSIEFCQGRNNSIEGCPKMDDPCGCASSQYPFSNKDYLSQDNRGCLKNNNCFLQDSSKCSLPNFPWDKNYSYSLRKCRPGINDKRMAFCEWDDGTVVSEDSFDKTLFIEQKNQKYFNPGGSSLKFLKHRNMNMDYNQCYKKCITSSDCYGFEYPADGAYCGLWLDGKLKTNNQNWDYFQGSTYILKSYQSHRLIYPALFKNETYLSCPVPSRFSFTGSGLKVRIVEMDEANNIYYGLSEYSQVYLWSVCSNCTDDFAQNFDITSNSLKDQEEKCSYEDAPLQEKKGSDGKVKLLYSTKGSKSIADFYDQYDKSDCIGEENKDFITIRAGDMNAEKCANLCYFREKCFGFELQITDTSLCWLWVTPNVCTANKARYARDYVLYLPRSNITWSTLAKTNYSAFSYQIYIHHLKFTHKSQKSSLKLYLREKTTNTTIRLFDSRFKENKFFDKKNLYRFRKMKFVSGGEEEFLADFSNGDETSNKVFHALDAFPPQSDEDLFEFQLGVEMNLDYKDEIEISGISFIINSWARPSSINRNFIPSKYVKSCVLSGTLISTRNNQETNTSVITLKGSKEDPLPKFKTGDLFSTFGCYVLNGIDFGGLMPAFITTVQIIDIYTTKLTLSHDVSITDIYSDATIDTSNMKLLSFSEALSAYEGFPQNSAYNTFSDWIEPKINDAFSKDQKNLLSFRPAFNIIPVLKYKIENSKIVDGSFSFTSRLKSQVRANFDRSGSSIKTDKRVLGTGESDYNYNYNDRLKISHEGKATMMFSIVPLKFPIGLLGSVEFELSASIFGKIDGNIFLTEGSMATLFRMALNIPKNLVSGNSEFVTADFLPWGVSEVSDAGITLAVTARIELGFLLLKQATELSFSYVAETKRSSEHCNGGSEARQLIKISLNGIARILKYEKDLTIFEEERELSQICLRGPHKIPEENRSPDPYTPPSGRRNPGEPFQSLDCEQSEPGEPVYWKPSSPLSGGGGCSGCSFFGGVGDFDPFSPSAAEGAVNICSLFPNSIACSSGENVRIKSSYYYGNGDGGSSNSSSSFVMRKGAETSAKAFAFGEPHIFTFSGENLLANEIGDFHLLTLKAPVKDIDICKNLSMLDEAQHSFLKEMEILKNSTPKYLPVDVQIRFLPGAWAPEMTMSVALAAKIGDEIIEVRQLLNKPVYDLKILVDGLEYDPKTAPLSKFKISFSKSVVFKGTRSCIITSDYFTIKWSPFSVSISLNSFITKSLNSDTDCAIQSEGIVGNWVTESVNYRFAGKLQTPMNDSTIKEFLNSWRVLPEESIISEWAPIYSDNTTKSKAPKNLSDIENTKEYLSAFEICESAFNSTIGHQLKLIDNNCWNPNLKKLNSVKVQLLKSCAYDLYITMNEDMLMAYIVQFETMKLPSPIECMAPSIVFPPEVINITTNIIDLKLFDSEIPKRLLEINDSLIFDMEYATNSTKNNVAVTLLKQNGSLSFEFKTKGSHSFVIGGAYKLNSSTGNLLDSYNLSEVTPGMNIKKLVVNYKTNLTNGLETLKAWQSILFVIFCICYSLL